MPLAARINDQTTCPVVNPPAHTGGPIQPMSGPKNVYIENMLAATNADQGFCTGVGTPNPFLPVSGSKTVFINGANALRQGDQGSHPGSLISTGASRTFIGG